MTPNPPSGTPTPRRSFKAEFKAWLAAKAGTPVRPFPGQAPTPLAPVAPAISQEQFTDAQRPVTQQQEVRTRQLMDRVCAVNNANVTRDYGTHTVDLTHVGMVPPDLSSDELADAKRLLGVRVGEPGREAYDGSPLLSHAWAPSYSPLTGVKPPPRCSTPPEVTAPESTL